MPWNVTIDPAQHVVNCRLYGRVTADEAIAARDSIPKNPAFNRDFNHLIDLSDVSQWTLSAGDMRWLAQESDPFSSGSKRIIVAPSDFVYGMARMYEAIGERRHPNQIVVRSVDEALRILNLSAA